MAALKEAFGFITYGPRENRLYFRLGELLDQEETLKINDEVEFTVVQVKIVYFICHFGNIRFLNLR